MQGRDLLRQFKDTPWTSPAQVEQFVGAAQDVTAADLLRLFEVLGTKPVLADPVGLRLRSAAFVKLVEATPDPALFVPFARALKTAEGPIRMLIVSLLPRVNNPAGHAELCAILRSPEPGLRKAASAALNQVGSKTIVDALCAFVRDPSFPGRIEAVDTLVAIEKHRAVSALGDVMKIGSPGEKSHALKYLADTRISGREPGVALRAIAPALEDPDVRLVIQAIQAAGTVATEEEWHTLIGPYLESKQSAVVKAAVESMRRYVTPRTIRALDRAFRMGSSAIKLAVLETAEAMGSELALPLLVEGLNHKSVAIRTRAGAAITQLSTSNRIDVSQTVMWLLNSSDAAVRRMAIDIAGKVKDPRGELWPQLLQFLRDEDWWVRERVSDALIEMAGKDLTRLMVGYLADKSEVVRRYAVGVLGRLKDAAAIGALVRTALEDSDWWVRESAIEAIASLNDARAIPYLVDIMGREPQLRRACVNALAVLDAKVAAGHVAALIDQERDLDVLLAILACLGKIGDRALAERVAQLADDPDHRVRMAARELMGMWQFAPSKLLGQTQGGLNLGLLDSLLLAAVRAEADDLIVEANRPPYIKKRGKVQKLSEHVLSADDLRSVVYPQLSPAQMQALAALKDVDLSYEVKAQGLRFRVSVFQQMSGLAAVFRVVNDEIPDIRKLGLPEAVMRFGDLKNGLVLVGGPSGAGKSTTLAAIVDDINRRLARHIVTLEDPIEVVHKEKKSHITQREVGNHSKSFANALRATLRQDPDVILVGEMRDLATISLAVTAAETGHLVLGTLHTVSADTSVDRLINAFPGGQQPQVRSMLASSLRAVLCQYLIPRIDGRGRVLAVEVMINNDAIANLIRKGKTFQISSIIATARELGMQSMDNELQRLFREGVISAEEAYSKATSKKEFEAALKNEAPRPAAVAPVPAPPRSGSVVTPPPLRSATIRPVPGQPIVGTPDPKDRGS